MKTLNFMLLEEQWINVLNFKKRLYKTIIYCIEYNNYVSVCIYIKKVILE